MILINEILHADNEEIIYKTVDLEENLYGLFSSKRGRIVEPSFFHIWEFEEDGTTVIIDQQENYWEMDWNGIVVPLDPKKEEEYKSFIIKNSRCNCWGNENLRGCQICGGMEQIENGYSDRSFNKFFGLNSSLY